MSTVHKIRFRGADFVLIDDEEAPGLEGPITTREDYAAFLPSYAHLFSDGRIMRHGLLIGHRDEIEFLGEEETRAPSFFDMLENWNNWLR